MLSIHLLTRRTLSYVENVLLLLIRIIWFIFMHKYHIISIKLA